jgi:hypothetical protein
MEQVVILCRKSKSQFLKGVIVMQIRQGNVQSEKDIVESIWMDARAVAWCDAWADAVNIIYEGVTQILNIERSNQNADSTGRHSY